MSTRVDPIYKFWCFRMYLGIRHLHTLHHEFCILIFARPALTSCSLEKCFWILVFRFWILDIGFWILDFEFWILDLDFGFCYLQTGSDQLFVGERLLDFGKPALSPLSSSPTCSWESSMPSGFQRHLGWTRQQIGLWELNILIWVFLYK